MKKSYDELYELMEKLASNHHQMMYDKTVRKNVLGVMQMDAFNDLLAQMVALEQTDAKHGDQDLGLCLGSTTPFL